MLDTSAIKELLGEQSPPSDGPSRSSQRYWYTPTHCVELSDLELHPDFTTNVHDELFDRPLMRLWDHQSGSRPEEDGTMLARASKQRLDTFEARKESLERHADWAKWDMPTPYISFSKTPQAVERNAAIRARNGRQSQKLTVIVPSLRFLTGLPTLHFHAEMQHYGVADPYNKDYAYYKDDYLCVWEVTPLEIVGHWDWEELSRNPNWYEDIILPAFRNHGIYEDFPLTWDGRVRYGMTKADGSPIPREDWLLAASVAAQAQ